METWRRSPLGPNHVEVSNLGRARTQSRAAPSRRAKQPFQVRAGRLLSPYINAQGYPTISIKMGSKRPKFAVHRLVASAFCDGYAPGLSVNHIDGDKTNNRAKNLEWVSLERNTALAWETGQCTAIAHASKLTPPDIHKIRQLLAAGKSGNSIAPLFGVSSGLIYLIRDGKRWASV